MKVIIDLNIFLDIFQKREPHYQSSSASLSIIIHKNIPACIPSHAITTIHYLLSKYSGRNKADEVIDWMLSRFDIVSATSQVFYQARKFLMDDFEDAVVASCAKSVGCDYIITRNINHFDGSPVNAVTPSEFIITESKKNY